ncbi:hypothetical protein KA977_07450, partial [Candidatus Dependentiae bacterium]|nr:hypothetical protein [Candidatus Dependentiae bacterium]
PIIMFTAPAYIIFIILNYKKIQINPKLIFKMFFLFLLPLCLYLIIMIRAKSNPVINIENPDTLSKLFDVMTARKYGMNLFSADSAELFKRFEYFIKLTINNFSIFELLLSASGICFLFFKNYKYLLLIMLIIISNVIISLNYKTADIDYYYLISFYSIALLSGSVIKFINNKIIIMFLILISLFFCWNKYSKNSEFCSKRGFFIESDIGKDIIAYIPENSILISGDILTPILNYYCYSENRGKKIVLISKNYFSEHYFRFLKNEYPDYIFPEVKDGTVIVKTGDVQDIIFDNLSKHKVFLTFDIPLINGYKLKKIIGNSFVLYEVLNPNFADDKNILIDDNQFKNNYKELLKKYESINNMINWEAYNSAKYIYEVLFSKIEYSLQKGDQQGFLKIFNDIIDIKPDYDEYYMRISNLFTLYGIYGEAEKCLLIVKPENRNELWNIFFGIIREKQNRKEEAVIFYKRSLEIKNNIDANIKLAYLYFNEKRFDEALFFFEQANSFVPGRLDILYNLAVSYYYAGKIDNSKKIVDALISSGNAEYSHKAIQLKHILNN